MKILTINVIGIPSGRSDTLVDANVFQDYDAVVVDPEDLSRLYGIYKDNLYYNYDEGQLYSDKGQILTALNVDRRKQARDLLQRGGVVVCFMKPMVRSYFEYNIEGTERIISVTNYDWLIKSSEIEKELGGIKYSRGETIDYIDSGHPFSEYLNIKPPWSAYVDKKACQDWRVLASAFDTHAVSIAKRVGLGQIILLPSYYDYHDGEIIKRCIEKLLAGREITPQPDWAKSILVPGQSETISKITKISDQIDALEKQKETLLDVNDKLERWKYLLYEKGKHRLEPVVREALELLKCTVEPQPDKDGDGLVTFEHGIALLEVGGSKGPIRIDKIGELTTNMGNLISKKGTKVKGILVGNPFCEESIKNRPPKGSQKPLFANELIESAETQGITVLLSTDLYEVVSRILSNKLPEAEKQSLRERIFKGKGLVRLA